MTEAQTISWIFLATAIASQNGPAPVDSISGIADGINHAIPTRQELDTALHWLIRKNLIIKTENKYSLTGAGRSMITEASSENSQVLQTWDKLDSLLNMTQ